MRYFEAPKVGLQDDAYGTGERVSDCFRVSKPGI